MDDGKTVMSHRGDVVIFAYVVKEAFISFRSVNMTRCLHMTAWRDVNVCP